MAAAKKIAEEQAGITQEAASVELYLQKENELAKAEKELRVQE